MPVDGKSLKGSDYRIQKKGGLCIDSISNSSKSLYSQLYIFNKEV